MGHALFYLFGHPLTCTQSHPRFTNSLASVISLVLYSGIRLYLDVLSIPHRLLYLQDLFHGTLARVDAVFFQEIYMCKVLLHSALDPEQC
jgi:hypothetical protein